MQSGQFEAHIAIRLFGLPVRSGTVSYPTLTKRCPAMVNSSSSPPRPCAMWCLRLDDGSDRPARPRALEAGGGVLRTVMFLPTLPQTPSLPSVLLTGALALGIE